MRQLFTFLFLLTIFAQAQAQQPPQYSLYMLNPLGWNPAYAGLDNSLSITGVFRKQWVGLEGSPTTQNISAHAPLYILGGGLGINVENDALGAEQRTAAVLAYSYPKNLGNGILSLGLGGGIVQRQLDGSKIRTPEGTYTEPGNFDHRDELLPLNKESATTTTFHAGVYYQSEKMEAGIAVNHLNEGQAKFSTLNLKLSRSYIFNLGFHFDLSNSLSLHPSALVRSDAVQTQTDFSVIVKYNDNIFGGAAFRGYNAKTADAVVLIAGMRLSEKLNLAYAYDLTLSELNTVSNGSHEISLNYNLGKPFGKGRPPKIIYNPRSL